MTRPEMTDQLDLIPPPVPWWKASKFSGSDVSAKDQERLAGQIKRIYTLMIDGQWRTLAEIETATGDPQASISAQLRNLRKHDFGYHTVAKRRRSESQWEYRVNA